MRERKVKKKKRKKTQCGGKNVEGDRKMMIWFGGVGFVSIDFLT